MTENPFANQLSKMRARLEQWRGQAEASSCPGWVRQMLEELRTDWPTLQPEALGPGAAGCSSEQCPGQATQEANFRLLADCIPHLVWSARPDGSADFHNARLLEYVGLRPGEMQGSAWVTALHPEDVERTRQIWEAALASGTEYQVEFRLRRAADGQYRWHWNHALPYRDSAGRVVRWYGTSTDIHEQRQAEEALRQAERFTHATLDALSAHICVLDETGKILAVNRAWREFAQANPPMPQRAMEGVNYLAVCDAVAGPDAALAAAAAAGIRAVLRGVRDRFYLEYPCHTQNELRWFKVRGSRFPGAGPARCVVAHEDITSRKQAEEELKSSREQLRALAARVEEAREEERRHAAREIHDVLAQELTRLKFDLAWLNRRLVQPRAQLDPAALKAKLAAMMAATDAASASVQKIAAELRPVVLDSLGLSAAIDWQARDLEVRTGIQCEVQIPGEEIVLDQEHSTTLFRILQESLTNVVRHAGATKVEIRLLVEPERVVLTVRDNGRGLAAAQFIDPRSLGLLGMRERAALRGGHCDISSVPGQGTTVEAWLPWTGARSGKSGLA